jgi:hypothetical protein
MMIVRIGLLLILLVIFSGNATAQMGMGGGNGAYALEEGERNLKFAGIPIPGYSEVLGWNIALVAMAYYKMDRYDDNLPPSATGIFGFYSENQSWMGGIFQKFHLDQDNWRITGAFGTGSIKYQFNPAGIDPGFPDIFLDYSQALNFLFAQGSRRVKGHLYLGLGAMSWAAKVGIEPDLAELPDERYTGPGLVGEWDRRDHTMYPTDGFLIDGRYMIFREAFGSDRDFQRLRWSMSDYVEAGDTNQVLAGRFLHQGAFGDVPFSAQSILSGNQNLRGYANGRYRGNQLITLETEYRWMFHRRWGAVAFAGIGWVADKISDMALNDTLPGAGIGIRYRIIETYKINARIDYGWGQDDQALYVSIGEHF